MASIEGLRVMQGTSRKTGKQYDGVILYLSHPEQGVIGVSTEDVFVQRDMFDSAASGYTLEELVGCDCSISYDRRGFVQDFQILT